MKVLIVNAFSDKRSTSVGGGHYRSMLQTAISLSERGHEVSVIDIGDPLPDFFISKIKKVTMNFRQSIRSEVRKEILDILSSRRAKFPRKLPNCGSVFKSNPAMYSEVGSPGEVIERLGLKGTRHGNMQISDKHANFIVNLGGGLPRISFH